MIMFTNGKRIRRKHSCEVFVLRGGGLSHPCDIIAAERLIPPPLLRAESGSLGVKSIPDLFRREKSIFFLKKGITIIVFTELAFTKAYLLKLIDEFLSWM